MPFWHLLWSWWTYLLKYLLPALLCLLLTYHGFADDLADLGYATETVGLRGDGQIAADGEPLIYTVSVEVNSVTARAYVVMAVPQATQATRSQCGTLRWNAQGTRSASGPKGDACWQR